MSKALTYLLKVFYTDGSIQTITRRSKRRISSFIQARDDSEIAKYYIRVTYYPIINNENKVITPINEGEYLSKQDLYLALRAFTEDT